MEKKKTVDIRSYKNSRTADLTLLEIATQQSRLITPRACLSDCRPVRYPPTPSLSFPATRAFPVCLVPAQTGSPSRARSIPFPIRSPAIRFQNFPRNTTAVFNRCIQPMHTRFTTTAPVAAVRCPLLRHPPSNASMSFSVCGSTR